MRYTPLIAALSFALTAPSSAQNTAPIGEGQTFAPTKAQLECITEREVVEAQQAWGEGIIKIGKSLFRRRRLPDSGC